MWPVNGTYSDTQRALYGFMIAYHKALLAGIRPGRTDDEIHREAAQTMAAYLDRTPFANPVHERAARSALEFPHHLSHPVGMAVHDVGHYRGRPLQPGIVFSVDPQMRIPEERLYLRVEDTVVVTADGCENLTARAAGDGRGRNDHARPVHPSAVPVQSPKGRPREAQGAGRFPRVALRSSREIVLAHKHVGRQVPLGRQFPNHCQSERAPTVEHLGRAWLRSDQFGEVLEAGACSGEHLRRRDSRECCHQAGPDCACHQAGLGRRTWDATKADLAAVHEDPPRRILLRCMKICRAPCCPETGSRRSARRPCHATPRPGEDRVDIAW